VRSDGVSRARDHQGGVLADVAEPGRFQRQPQPASGGLGLGQPGRPGSGFCSARTLARRTALRQLSPQYRAGRPVAAWVSQVAVKVLSQFWGEAGIGGEVRRRGGERSAAPVLVSGSGKFGCLPGPYRCIAARFRALVGPAVGPVCGVV
jgi:hypothetical protein